MTPRQVLQQVFGFAEFRGPQLQVIERVLRNEHALLIMPTGMGKSLCYQIPALCLAAAPTARSSGTDRPPLSMVISPLIALMKDQVDALVSKDVAATFVNSSLDREEREKRYAGIRDGQYSMLYVTPERFRKPEFIEALQHRQIVLLAVDEAHCISQWGHDFRPDYTRLAAIRELLGQPTTIALTATATPETQRDIVSQLGLEDTEVQVFHEGIERPNLALDVVEVWGEDDKLKTIGQVQMIHPGAGIVYFTLIRTLAEFSERMAEQGIPHLVYHGELERRRRRQIQDAFMQGQELVLATNAFGMGVDKNDIRYVVHADIPGSLESYYQEIGRAGRDGIDSQCVLLYDERDLATQMEFIRWSNPDRSFYERVLYFLQHEREQIAAFGLEWLREKLHARQRHDRRLEAALLMLERHGVIEGNLASLEVEIHQDTLPEELADDAALGEKLRRDQLKLLAMVKYAKTEPEERRKFLQEYFGIASPHGPEARDCRPTA